MMITCLMAIHLVQEAAPESLHYQLTVEDRGAAEARVEIAMSFTGEADGETVIILPSSWGGEAELWNVIEDLTVSGEAELIATEAPHRYVIRHAPDAALTVHYSVVQDRPGVPRGGRSGRYRPFVQPGYVHLIGSTIFIRPESPPAEVSFSSDIPEGWAFASDLEHGVDGINDLYPSVIVAGDFRIRTYDVGGAPVRIALRDETGFSEDAFAESLRSVVEASQAYWGDEGEPYLVTVLPLEAEPGQTSLGGTNLGDSFAFFATRNAEAGPLVRILQHEHTHTWNPTRLGGAIPGETEAAGYWFSEGFTDFLTERIGVRGGVWSAETSVENWNEALSDYAASPLRAAANAVITEQFWTSGDAQRLPYLRGQLFAALIDQEIRAATEGAMDLDDVLFAMREASDEGPAPTRLVSTVQAVAGLDIQDLYERHILNGAAVLLTEQTFAGCGVLTTEEVPAFDYGMTLRISERGGFEVDVVDPDGPAAPAGFQPGMRILERLEGAVGDASVDSVLRVETLEGEVLDLRYRPTNGETLPLQQIQIDETFDAAACMDRLAGR